MKDDAKETGLYLLKKGKQGIFRMIFSRSGLILVLLAVQVLFLFSIFHWFEAFLPHIYGGVVIFTVFMVLYLLNSSMDPTAKITWLVVVMLLPIFGALLFLYTQKNIGHRALRDYYEKLNEETGDMLTQDEETEKSLRKSAPGAAALARYVRRSGCYPVYEHTDVTYFPLGEDKFQEMLIRLEKAEHFIFLEYFIVDEGQMWGRILEILARKVKEGVDVRVLYDGTCELSTLPHDYPKRLRELGIQCKMFAPIKPFVSTHYNYRDHRKILVIDGNVAFNGGVNLADEYINAYEKYGHSDKYIPFALALTHYKNLLESGVKIYEYTPGFVHAKVFVCDDREAVVGTINLDYRSLYHHFECATYMWGTDCISEIVDDFHLTQEKCREMTADMVAAEPLKRRVLGFIAKAAAPLM